MREFISQARFAVFPAAMVAALATFAMGGAWTWLVGVALLVVNIGFDAVGEDYLERVATPWRPFLETVVFSVPVLLTMLTLAMFVLTASPGTPMAAVAEHLGLAPASLISWVGTVFTAGHIAGTAAVAFAHELVHRPRRFEWLIAQAVLALCLHPSIAIAHVHGHHVHVGTPRDPSTARRGVSFWRFLPIAVAREIRESATIEARRLANRGQPVWSPGNRFLHGMAFLVAWLILAALLAGPSGLVALIVSGVIGLIVVEVGNYVTHYGLVRVPGRPIMARHSWNAPRFGSTSSFINTGRHSHHHAGASRPYWALELADEAAVHRHGLAAMSVLAFVPPLWFAVMAPELADWDARMASVEERAIIATQART